MRRHHCASLLACVLWMQPLQALEVGTLDTSVVGRAYHVQFDAVLEAPAAGVARVLTAYADYAMLDPRIRSSEVIGRTPAGQVLLRTRVRACVGILCRTVVRTERVTEAPGRIVAEVLPEASEVRRGVTRTQWHEEAGGRTRVRYQADFEPAFRVPDLIARRYAAGDLRQSVLRLWASVEEQARDN